MPLDWTDFTAVLFDLDGVITPTATIHEQAWSELFAPWSMTNDDYLRRIDGKPRYEGVQSFLADRGVELPWGDPTDAPGDTTICALGNKKNEIFGEILERDGVTPYPGSVQVLDHLDDGGVAYAIVSSSRNAQPVLAAAGLSERFEIIVDGVRAADEQLAGKPDPAMFLRGAELVDAAPRGCVVVEDATSGVAAGAAGGFGFVLGVDRGNNRAALFDAGADAVVDDLLETIRPEEASER